MKNQEEDGSHKKINFHFSTSDPEYEMGFVTDYGSEGPKIKEGFFFLILGSNLGRDPES